MNYNIYLISAEINEQKSYKIGITKRRVEDRIRDFKTGNSSKFDIEQIFTTDKLGLSIEKRLHKHFADKQIQGEWFNLDKQDIYDFLKLCSKYKEELTLLNESNTYMLDKGIKFK